MRGEKTITRFQLLSIKTAQTCILVWDLAVNVPVYILHLHHL